MGLDSNGGASLKAKEKSEIADKDKIASAQQALRAKTRPDINKKNDSALSLFGGRYVPPKGGAAAGGTGAGRSGIAGAGSGDRENRENREKKIPRLHAPLTNISYTSTRDAVSDMGFDTDTADTGGVAMEVLYADAEVSGSDKAVAEVNLKSESERTGMAMAMAIAADSGGGGDTIGSSVSTEIEIESAVALMDMEVAKTGHAQLSASEIEVAIETEIEVETEIDADTDMQIGIGRPNGTAPLVRVPVSSDPAFRIRFLACLAAGWPSDCGAPSTSSSTSTSTSASTSSKGVMPAVSESRKGLLLWACKIGCNNENWAVRRASFQLLRGLVGDPTLNLAPLPRIMTSIPLSSGSDVSDASDSNSMVAMKVEGEGEGEGEETMLHAVLSAVEGGVLDARFAKVRMAALEALEAVLIIHCYNLAQGSGGTRDVTAALGEKGRETVRQVLRRAAGAATGGQDAASLGGGESAPEVLEKAMSLQKFWLQTLS